MPGATARVNRAVDHRFFIGVSLGIVLLVFAGFARTYFLKGLFGTPPLTALVHLHGAIMTLWVALFVAQVSLISLHRVAIHRKLGYGGIFLAGLVVVMGIVVSFGLARRRLLAHPDSVDAPMLLGLQLFGMVLLFIAFVTLGVLYRRRPDYHKRFMALAMLSVMGPAITRLPIALVQDNGIMTVVLLNIGLVLLVVIADAILQRRLHPVFACGAGALIASVFVVAGFAQTPFWIQATKRLVL